MNNNFLDKKMFMLYGVIILIIHYLISFAIFNLNIQDGFFLSLGYPSDPVIIPLIFEWQKILFSNSYHFSNIFFYLPEYLIQKLFGFNYIWITAIFYKIIYFYIITNILLSYKNIINKNTLSIFILIIVFLLCSNYELNVDRIIRPSLSNIFECYLIISLLKCYTQKSISNKDSIFFGISSASILSLAPWDFFFITPLFLINLKYINSRKLIFFLISFVIIYSPNIKSNIILITENSLHLEYLGLKEIYNIKLFVLDFFTESLKSKRILLAIFLITTMSLINKNYLYIKLIFLSLIFGFLPYIVLTKTVLSYHILQGLFNFLFFLCIFCLHETLTKQDYFFLKIKKTYLQVISLILVILITYNNFITPNSWLKRSFEIKKNYIKHFKNLDNLDEDLIIVTNDKYLRAFSYINKIQYLPKDGFFNNDEIIQTLRMTAGLIKKSSNNINKDLNTCLYLKSSTENLFDSTRSTKSKLLVYKQKKLKKIHSSTGWVLSIPENIKLELIKILKNDDDNNKNKKLYFYDDIYGHINLGIEKRKCSLEDK